MSLRFGGASSLAGLSIRSWTVVHGSLSTQSYQNGLARTQPGWLGLMLYMHRKSITLVSGFLAMRSWRTNVVSLNDGQSVLTKFSQVTRSAMRPSVSLTDPSNGRHEAPCERRWRAGWLASVTLSCLWGTRLSLREKVATFVCGGTRQLRDQGPRSRKKRN